MQVLPDTSIATDLPNIIPNDGTNACVFLALSIGDTFLQTVKKVESVSWEELVKVAEKTITKHPGKINPFRNATERYDPLDTKAILTANNLLGQNCKVFANSGERFNSAESHFMCTTLPTYLENMVKCTWFNLPILNMS